MVPEGWYVAALEELTSKGISYGIVQTGDSSVGDVPCVRVVDLTKKRMSTDNMIATTEEISRSYRKTILEPEEIMLALRGEIGLVRMVPEDLVGCNLTRGVARIAGDRAQIDPQYLLWALRSSSFRRDLMRRVNGSALQEIPLGELKKVPLFVPPIVEQSKIAEILSIWDRAIETVEKLIANNEQQKKAVVQRTSRGSEQWEAVRLGNVATLKAGGTPPTGKAEYWDGDVPWMSSGEINLRRIGDVEGRISDAGLANSSAKMLPSGCVLVALAGQGTTRGKVAINLIPLSTNQSVAAILPSQKLDAEYLFHNLESRYNELRSLSLGDGGRGGLNLSILKSLLIPLAPLPEQKEIARSLNVADSEIKKWSSLKRCLQSEKAALMQQLLTGKRRVRVDADVHRIEDGAAASG